MVHRPSPSVEEPVVPPSPGNSRNIRDILKSYLENYHKIMGNQLGHMFSGSNNQAPTRRERRGAMQPLIAAIHKFDLPQDWDARSSITSGFEQQSTADTESDMGEDWENKAYVICERLLGEAKYNKRLNKISQAHQTKIGDKTRLNMEYSKAKKTVGTNASYIKRCNAVGAVGYAVVTSDPRVPDNDFFRPDRRFRLRLRHSNLRSDDDAAASPREAAIKFADQNEDGPLDIILITGRIAPARNCKNFMEIIRIKTPEETKQMCLKDPHFYFSLVDSVRRGPDSFADLSYHSQIPYQFIPKDGKSRLVRFRLIPAHSTRETGLLDSTEQENPWEVLGRRALDVRSPHYLRAEFLKRIECEPIDYILQIQIMNCEDPNMWNPQELWDEDKHPWLDLADVKLTTALTSTALNRTYFNIVDKPICFKFPPAMSVHGFKSYHHVLCGMYTKFEIKHMRHSDWGTGEKIAGACNAMKVQHIITVCAGPVKETRPRVDVFLTLTGTQGRSTPRRLDCHYEGDGFVHSQEIEHYEINTEPVGEILALTIAVRHRHLTDDWYLRYVVLSNPQRTVVRHFPCNSVVLAKVTLRSGDVSLPQHDCHEVLRQERKLEIRDRQNDYLWHRVEGLPSQIRGKTITDIPVNEQLRAEKYTGVPWEVDHALGDVLLSLTALRSSTHQMSLTSRQTSYDPNMNRPNMRRNQFNRQVSAPAVRNMMQRKSNPRARMRWTKLKLAISFIAKVKLPDGPRGEMCRTIQDDLDFGRMFLHGSNPTILKKCTTIPENFPISEEEVQILLDRGRSLTQEALDGHIYIANYAVLENIPTYHQDADHRFIAAPMCLFYVRTTGNLTPIAIQINQEPGPDNPIWTPKERCPEDWLMAKLWVKCADFHHQFIVSHLLKSHLLIEPFAIATMRQLSESHPVYKLLKPHFRYTMPMNTLIRSNILKKGGALDKWTSLGSEGAKALMKKYMATFYFEELDLLKDLETRGMSDAEKLPNYLYREDGVRLWQAITHYCEEILNLCYTSSDDVENDTEIQRWIKDLHDNGFPTLADDQRRGLPTAFTSISELSRIVTKVIFTATCFHSATHQDALDLYGFLPLVPGMMRQLPPHKRGQTNRDFLVNTLPEQSPEAYYGSLANVLQQCRPDENPIGNYMETYFVEDEATEIQAIFQRELHTLARTITARNMSLGITYDNMSPNHIPNAVEPVPFLPTSMTDDVGGMPQFDKANLPNMFAMGPSVPLMTLPLCMQFARNVGGKSVIGRRLSVNMFSKAMGGVGLDKVSVPLNAMDRNKFSLNRYQYNRAQMNMYNTMYDGLC